MEKLTKAIILLITYDCNLKCSYCYEPKTAHHKMTLSSAKAILQKEFASLDSKYTDVRIQFMGGEPLLQFDFIKEISEWLWESDFNVKIEDIHAPTNGTLLTPLIKKWLTDNKERFTLSLSFDGDRLMQNINRSGSAASIDLDFFARTYPNVTVKMTLSPNTIGNFYEGVTYLYNKGFKQVGPNLAMGESIGWKREHLPILAEQLDKLVNFYSENPEIERVGLFNLPIWKVLSKDVPDISCRVGRDIVCYDYDGKDYPCHIFSPIAMSRQLAEESRSLDFEAKRNDLSSPCFKCVFNKLCARCCGVNLRDRGDFNQPSTFDCAQFKLFFYANCKLQILFAKKKKDYKQEEIVNKIIKNLLSQIKNRTKI